MSWYEEVMKFPISLTTAWILLVLAGGAEIGWAVGMKFSEGLTRLWPSIMTVVCLLLTFPLFAIALKVIPLSTGYAIWTGIGVAGTALIGMFVLGEPKTTLRMLCFLMILAGIVGLKFSESHGV